MIFVGRVRSSAVLIPRRINSAGVYPDLSGAV